MKTKQEIFKDDHVTKNSKLVKIDSSQKLFFFSQETLH